MDAKAACAHSLSTAWLATPLTAVELQGVLTSVVEGYCAHSFRRRLTGTARCSVGIGGQASLTCLFDSAGIGDRDRGGRLEVFDPLLDGEGDSRLSVN